jgi:glycosyltransferase involved in cell wall biosynthesis
MVASAPAFSIVIPTRARADTLEHAVRTALTQTFTDVEVIVHESGADPATAALLAQIDDPRLRAYTGRRPVPMTENWEQAVRQARGDYVFVLGDDDGLLPDACAIAARLLATRPGPLLSWRPAVYYWPRHVDPVTRDRLFVTFGAQLTCTTRASRPALELVYRFRETHDRLPMIYNSFVARAFIDSIHRRRGRYFFGSMPDVMSGILNAFFSDHYLVCNRPLSVWGVSQHSTGYRVSASGDRQVERVARAEAFGEVQLHPTMVASSNEKLCIGNEYLIAKADLFPDDPPEFGYAELLHAAAQTINQVPNEYDAVRRHCLAIAAKSRVRFDERDVPPRGPRLPLPRRGRREIAPGVVAVDLDASPEGATNVFDVTRILARHLPDLDGVDAAFVAEGPPLRDLAVAPGQSITVDFSAHGNGTCLLGPGWSVLEPWGVWSVGRRSDLILPFRTSPGGPVRIRLSGRVYRPPRDVTILVQAGSRIPSEHRARLDRSEARLELSPVRVDASGASCVVRLIIEISPSTSPADVGAGADVRRLGFGLERLTLTVDR